MGKPRGTYLTLEADRLSKADEDYHSEISEELAHQIRRLMTEMIGYREEDLPSVLVVGLGNDSVTPRASWKTPMWTERFTPYRSREAPWCCITTRTRSRKWGWIRGIGQGVCSQLIPAFQQCAQRCGQPVLTACCQQNMVPVCMKTAGRYGI